MGKMNMLKANWYGKVGETVGAKWKDKSTIRTFSKPTDPKTQSQEEVRGGFKQQTKFFALFSDSIRYINALDTKGMSVKNALIKLNKDYIKDGTTPYEDFVISKGGLQKPNVTALAYASATGKVTATVVAPTASNFSANAKAILVAVCPAQDVAVVSEALYTETSLEATLPTGITEDVFGYVYYFDKRGSSKVASLSVGKQATV